MIALDATFNAADQIVMQPVFKQTIMHNFTLAYLNNKKCEVVNMLLTVVPALFEPADSDSIQPSKMLGP